MRAISNRGRRRRGGGGVATPALLKTAEVGPRRNLDISETFFLKRSFFEFSNIFKIKRPKSEEKLNFGVGGFVYL